jgi:type III secretory pathway component EscV
MKFDPEKSMFIQEFGKLLDEMKKVFDDQKNEVQRVITHNDLMPLVTGLITESGPKFNTIVETSYKYHTVSNKIIATLEEDFKFLEQSSKKWEQVREIFEATKSYD